MKSILLKFKFIALLLVSCAVLNNFTADCAEVLIDYESQVKPILARHCYQCHGAEMQESDLRLDTAKHAIAGGVLGEAVQPGKPDESLLLQAVLGSSDEISRMPPEDEAEALSTKEVALISSWIQQGARYPEDEQEIVSTKKLDHWSFKEIKKYPPPQVEQADWVINPIDQFILKQLEEKQLTASEMADRVTLIRRVSLDLIGLPPTRAEVQEFLKDESPQAYQKVVDRLLASPHYGERWGRLWLDLARYADSDGYTNDQPKVMWKYRDWVIDALNQNMPFDQFTIEQFAGDMLPNPTTDQLVATGFHRNTQINREGGSDREQYRTVAVNDRVATTGTVYLGLTLGCARCHNHKFDPISQREYYELFAILNNQDEPTHTLPLVDPVPDDYQDVSTQLAEAEKVWKKASEEEKTDAKKKVDQLRKQRDSLKKKYYTSTYVMRERSTPRETRIFIRGDFPATGKVVQPNVPAMLHELSKEVETPTRLDLARWLGDPQNPLTPRVTVNRIWQRYFGTGIVATENDFGTQGAKPSHPQLLDWLASQFIESGYDLKQLHKLIVTSATYRQSSQHRSELKEIDPDNRLLARQSRLRLDAELIRDSALHSAGVLSPKLKGPSVFPPQPDGVMKLTRNPNRRWNADLGENRFRRTMYTYFWRSTPYPFLKTFDSPESNTSCSRRDRSNTPLQALTLLNEEGFVEAAQLLAIRVLKDMPNADEKEQLEYAFQLCLKREPSSLELQTLSDLLQEELANSRTDATGLGRFSSVKTKATDLDPQQMQAWTTIARTLLNLDEFITRE